MPQRCFILGAPKCGTTTLAHWLDQTPSIFMSDPKEPHFYASDYVQTWENIAPGKEAYEALFASSTHSQAAEVDGSTNYLSSVDAIDTILKDQPDAKFVVCLRNPVEMARSLHAHALFWGLETLSDFKVAWNEQDARARGEGVPDWHPNPHQLQYQKVCSTGTQVEHLMTLVPAERVLFVFIEDLANKPDETYASVVRFLGGLPADILFDSRNVTRERRSNPLNRKVRLLKHSVSIKPLRFLVNLLGDANTRWNTIAAQKRKMDPVFRTRLTEEFKTEVATLEKITGRDLSAWKV
jgi:hypothetical protein